MIVYLLSLDAVLVVFSYSRCAFVVVGYTRVKHCNSPVYPNTQPISTVCVIDETKCQTQSIHHHTQQKTIHKPKILRFLSIVNLTSIFF